jgi:hypothetical protein
VIGFELEQFCRKKNREMKAFAKQVQTEKEKQRTKSKKDHISDMTKLRKQREKSGFAGTRFHPGCAVLHACLR